MLLNLPHYHDGYLQCRIEHFENEKGSMEVSICNNCNKVTQIICNHDKNSWIYTRNADDPEEQNLLCDLCKADGT